MGKLNNLGQTIKGNIQQVKGEVEDRSGNHVDGTIDKIKGKTNVAIADVKNTSSNY